MKRGSVMKIVSTKRNSIVYLIFIIFFLFFSLATATIAAPCQIRSTGCYKTGDVKVNPGEISRSEFAYYLPENKCIRSGDCDCRGVSDNVVEQTNPDQSNGACSCIARTDWNNNGRCCGDDAEDCGKIISGALCSISEDNEIVRWKTYSQGEVNYVGCSKAEYLADQNTWVNCQGNFWKKDVSNRDYICIGRGKGSIVECRGDGPPKSTTDGQRLSTGKSINPAKYQSGQQAQQTAPTGSVVYNTGLQSITGNLHLSNSKAKLCQTINYFGICEDFSNDDPDLNGNTIGDNRAKSIQVAKGFTVTLCDEANYLGVCEKFSDDDSDLSDNAIGMDRASSIKIELINPIQATSVQVVDGMVSTFYEKDAQPCPSGWVEYAWDTTAKPGTGTRLCKHFTTVDTSTVSGQRVMNDKIIIDFDEQKGATQSQCPSGYGGSGLNPSSTLEWCTRFITLAAPGTYQVVKDLASIPGASGDKSVCEAQLGQGWQSIRFDQISKLEYCKKFVTINIQAPKPSITQPSVSPVCVNTVPKATISWAEVGRGSQGYVVDIDNDGNWANGYWNKNIPSGTLSTTAPDNFNAVAGATGQLIFNGGSSYQVRIFYVAANEHSPTASFNAQICIDLERTYYCRQDGRFVTDLDTPDAQRTDTNLNTKNKKTCELAGFIWTGTKCCSEADDNLTNNKEFYNDADGNGACWNSTYVRSIDFVNGTNESLISYKGAFHGCVIDKNNYNKNNDVLLSLKDKHTSNPLITNHDYCFNDSEKKYYCSYTERWVQITDDIERNHLSNSPLQNPSQKAECCPQNECWNASQCISNQKFDPTSLPLGNTTARCIDGNWINSTKKTAFDGGASGYCPSEAQCLFNALLKNESSCINSGQYVADNYCENGKWSSRTKLLALKLLKLKSGDYTLFCDTRENALNNLQYFIPESNEIVVNILTNIQTNNFCVLKAGSTVIGATSINKNLEDLQQNSLNIFGVVDCKPALIDDGQYHSCDSTNKVWYNKRLKSFIYSSSSISVPSEEEQVSFIGNIIKTIIDAIKRLITSQPFNVAYLENIKKFDKLYMAQQGSRAIRGTIEGTNPKNTVVEYESFDTDICQFIGQFNRTKSDAFSGIACKKEANKYYVFGQGSKTTNFNPEDIWPDLTSKLRLK